ncbi:MAG: deoxyribonuclease IV [Acidobacteriota bacterium]
MKPASTRGPLVGAHMSIAGGLHLAVQRAVEVGCLTLQIFVKNASQWKGRELMQSDVELFRRAVATSALCPVVAHDSYLINMAAPDGEVRRKSLDALVDELERCERLGLSQLVAHPGSHLGEGEQIGIERVASAINWVHDRLPGYSVKLCLELTAGQGSNLGYRFEHLRDMRSLLREPERTSVCLDTCHLLAAGYDICSQSTFRATLDRFCDVVGLEQLAVIHVNDSRKGLGSRVDRHEHIGKGCIGEEGFRCVLREPRLESIPKILETPKEDSDLLDRMNLATLRRLAG